MNQIKSLLEFNPGAKMEVVAFDDRHFCLVVDDALIDPEAVVRWAADRQPAFRPVDFNYYPGSYLMAPGEMTARLSEYFVFHARRRFDARRCIQTLCRFSLVTKPPSVLHPLQWLCHRDDGGLAPALSMQASLLYLFRDVSMGGTAFYAPARTAAEIKTLFADAGGLAPEVFADRYGLRGGYMDRGNEWFRPLGNIEAKWNRLIIYEGSMWHTGDIGTPERLTADPRTGRLTLNGFFTCRRNLGGSNS